MFSNLMGWVKSVLFHFFSSPVEGEFEVVVVDGKEETVQRRELDPEEIVRVALVAGFTTMLAVLYFWGFYGLGVFVVVSALTCVAVKAVSLVQLDSQK